MIEYFLLFFYDLSFFLGSVLMRAIPTLVRGQGDNTLVPIP